jgi:hypothetical protein
MSLARILNKRTLLACTAIGVLIAAVTVGQQMLDGEPVLAATSTDQQAPLAVHAARRIARVQSSLPQTPDCDDFAFAFLRPSCSKAHVRHVARHHRVATTVISHAEAGSSSTMDDQRPPAVANVHGVTEVRNSPKAGLSAATQHTPTATKKLRSAKDNSRKTVVGASGDWFTEQRRQHTAMRSFFE